MKNKAFTLVELLAVIVVLGLIALIVTPVLIRVMNKQSKRTFEESIHGIMRSVEIDYSDDDFNFPREYYYENGTLTLLTVGEKDRNEVVKTNGKLEGKGTIYVDEDGDIIIDGICSNDYCASKGKDDSDITIDKSEDGKPVKDELDPVITLNGEKEIYVEIGETYEEAGATAKTYGEEVLEYTMTYKKDGNVVEDINTNIAGTYTITYTASSNSKTVSVSRIVYVQDMTPVIVMSEEDSNYVKSKNVSITITGVNGNSISNFSYIVKKDTVDYLSETVNGTSKTISLIESGIYEVTVNVEDNKGHSSSLTRTYKIDSIGPEITFDKDTVEVNLSEISAFNPYEGVSITDNVDGEIIANKTNVKISGELSSKVGTYTLTYTVEDKVGNESSKDRTVIVKESEQKPSEIIVPGPSGEEGIIIEDTEHNKRYSGSNPNNWVCFGSSSITDGTSCDENHKWRIIGLFRENMKIMTNYYYSEKKVWDTNETYGSNDWGRPADLNTELNGESFYSNNTYIDTTHRGYIANGTWYIGGDNSGTTTLQGFEMGERGKSTKGYIGLMSMTDVGYAGSNCVLTINMNSSNSECMTNNWIEDPNNQWSITPYGGNSSFVWVVIQNRISHEFNAYLENGVRPALYLDQNVRMIDGTGTESDPYILGIVNGPVIGLSSESSDDKWIKATNIEVTATDTRIIESFKYEVFKDGKSIGEETVTVNENSNNANTEVPLSEDGEYSIKVTARNTDGAISTKSSGIYKIDVTAPTISFTDITIKDNEVEEYDLMTGVEVSDKNGTPTVTTSGSLASAIGTYIVIYTAEDEAGNTTSKVRTIIVEKSAPKTSIEIVEKDPDVIEIAGGYRYQGGNPNNYVSFNGELFRIIGVFDGQMKIMQNEFYSIAGVQWSSSKYNVWMSSTLNNALNTTYWDKISHKYQVMVDQSYGWRVGSSNYEITRAELYNELARTIWTGKVGLIDLEDYAYATNGTNCDENMARWQYNQNGELACYSESNNWINKNGNIFRWLITPYRENQTHAFRLNPNGLFSTDEVTGYYEIRPTLYLKSNVKIIGGKGTESEPYLLSKDIDADEQITTETPGIKTDTSGNKRYAGSNPNNYVCFGTDEETCSGKQLWRIIGIIDGSLKLINTEYYSEGIAYDETSENSNDWTRPATLNTELHNNVFNNAEWINSNIQKSWMCNNKWRLSKNSFDTFESAEIEEKNGGYTTSNYVGMMTVTDYIYASSSSECASNTRIILNNTPCMNDNWLKPTLNNEWTITPYNSGNVNWMGYINISDNRVAGYKANQDSYGVRPVVILDSGVKITSGSGTEENPYLLSR